MNFDEALLPEDSWLSDLAEDEFEVERIKDMRSGRPTCMAGCTDSLNYIGKDRVIRRVWMKPT